MKREGIYFPWAGS